MPKAAFIDIDKYSDASVREITGAVRDAQALWKLVSDMMPSAAARLLTNADAIIIDFRAALHETLTAATEDDTVIFIFSGHGTRSRFVTDDTFRSDLHNSTNGAAPARIGSPVAARLLPECA